MKGFKILTEDYRSPIQGGKPLLTSTTKLPFTLPKVELDTSDNECGAGWNFCKTIPQAIKIAKLVNRYGLNKIYEVEGSKDSIVRDSKCRCSELTLVSQVTKCDFEPNGKNAELQEWLDLEEKEENKQEIEKSLLETLKIKGLDDWIVEFKEKVDYYNNYNNYNNYYNNYYNYYNNYYYNYNYYNYNYYNNYDYNYIAKSLFEPNTNYRTELINAYVHQMRQLRFDINNKKLLVWTKSQLPTN